MIEQETRSHTRIERAGVMAVDAKLMTVEDLLAMPDDGRRTELVRGELIEMPPPGHRHARLQYRIARLLGELIEDPGLGTVGGEEGVVISRNPATVLGPDVTVFLGDMGSPGDEPEGYVDRLPDIVFEIVSPSDSADEVQDKLWTYHKAGIPLIVAVWPRRKQVTEVRVDGRWSVLTSEDGLDLSELVAGVTIPVTSIFQGAAVG